MNRAFWVYHGANRINTIHEAYCKQVSVEDMVMTYSDWVGFDKKADAAVYALKHSGRSAWNCRYCGGLSQ